MDKKLVAIAVSGALGAPMAAEAVEFSVSGHVNKALVVVDQDGNAEDGELRFVDANSSESRFRFKGSEELDGGLTIGVNMEFGAGGHSDVGGKDGGTHYNDAAPRRGLNAIRKRQQNVYLSSAAGTLTLGLSSTATDGVAHADLGGPAWLGGATNWCSYHFDGLACASNDGNRRDVLKYDSPALGPATISTSIGNEEFWDAELTVAGSVGESGYDLRVGYTNDSEASGHDGLRDTLTASAAFKFSQGTAFMVGWSQVDSTDHEYLYLKLDHSYGDGSIAAYYKRAEQGSADGSLWGLAVGHDMGGGATAYAGVRFVEDDIAEDSGLFLTGMRVTFN